LIFNLPSEVIPTLLPVVKYSPSKGLIVIPPEGTSTEIF